MAKGIDLSKPEDAPDAPEDTPSVRGVVYCKEPTEAFELEVLNMDGIVIGMRVDGSSIMYIPWARVLRIEVLKSQNPAEAA